MGRLSLVIADYDAEYLQNFEKYLVTNHPKRFEISSFSSVEPFVVFLDEFHKIDILLVNSRIYNEIARTDIAETVLILSDNEQVLPVGRESINKYQHMDKLISEAIRLYSLSCRKDCQVSGNEGASIISVVSPAGGTGTSSIAAGCSILSAGRGLRPFYLNLEDIPSTGLFFHGESKQSFSNVIYQLKGNGGNLWMKLETAKCIDCKTGVHFFKPAESILEMNELCEEEISRLVLEFRKSSAYSYVFIDLPSGLSERNSSVLKHSDIILLVLSYDFRMHDSISKFKRGLELIENKMRANLTSRLVPVLNFSKGQKIEDGFVGYKPIAEIADYSEASSGNFFIKPVENPAFLADLNKVISYVIPDKKQVSVMGEGASALLDGGEYIA